jgi:soluble lytic murein transglycosylase
VKRFLLSTSALLLLVAALALHAQSRSAAAGETIALARTIHPTVPTELSQVWLAPERSGPSAAGRGASPIATAIRLNATGEYTRALAAATQAAAQQGTLAQYASYYAAVAQLRLGQPGAARRAFQSLLEQHPVGYLSEAAALGEAEADEAVRDFGAAVSIYERLLKGRPAAIEEITLRLGRALKNRGDLEKAAEAFVRVYYEYALSEPAPAAGTELALLPNLETIAPKNQRYRLELGRTERLFATRQYTPARANFEALRPVASGDDRELIQLRLAECDYFLKRQRLAREALRPFIERASRQGEALYFYAIASRDLGEISEFQRTVRRIVDEFPTQSWAEEALNSLAQYHLVHDDTEEQSDALFRELYSRYPKGSYAERAAWKAGWRSYREGRYAETVHYFERAAADFPRSDYRPAWLYWSGRAHERLNERTLAEERYALDITDYQNTYHGRLALKRIDARAVAHRLSASGLEEDGPPPAAPPPPNAAVVRALLAAELYDDALNELRFAQKVWGDTPVVQATIAWTNQQQARSESGLRRFQLLRGAINTMRRAYPQYLTAGGEELPRELQTVIFPIAYWELIKKYSAANGLDPYLVAALTAQESTFVADIKSNANAYGLMQLVPLTARQYARKLGLPYSARLLTDPEANIRMGTAYLADKVREFGDMHLVLASYNAGERAVRRWVAERPGLEREEFIDDIPYPETQQYVRKLLGTAEDYRRLYSGETRVDGLESTLQPRAVAEAVNPTANAPAKKAPASKPAAKKPVPKRRTTPAQSSTNSKSG